MIGWIKFHRKILDNPIFVKPDLFQLFAYCLLRANHSETKIIWNESEEILEKGCFITGRKVMAVDLGQNERTTYDRLKLLEKLKMISVKSNNKFSIVKVLNYSVYQGEEVDDQQPANNQPTTNQQPANTDKNVKKVKNEKNVKKCIPKNTFGEKVHLSVVEYGKLVDSHSEKDVLQMIDILDNWYLTKGKPPYESDYHTMIGRGWVLKRFNEDQSKQGKRDPGDKPPTKTPSKKYDNFYL